MSAERTGKDQSERRKPLTFCVSNAGIRQAGGCRPLLHRGEFSGNGTAEDGRGRNRPAMSLAPCRIPEAADLRGVREQGLATPVGLEPTTCRLEGYGVLK